MRTTTTQMVRGLMAVLGGAVMFVALLAPSDAVAQIATSKHNLGSTGTAGSTFAGTTEICVFCHTPHGANTSVAAPLWNKTVPTGPFTTYSTGNSYSIDGDVASVGSVSLACLSCHDGSLAIATMINQPGSGGYNAGGAILAGSWSAGGNVDSGTGKMAATAVTNLGTNLVNDHPIGIGYCGSSVAPTGATLTCGDPDFSTPSTALVNGSLIWFVEGGTPDNVRQKTDLSLYTRSGDALPRVECASCHDPHSTANGTFLRRSNVGSGLCLTCHVK